MRISDFIDPFGGGIGTYHLSMPHLSNNLLFNSDNDYIVGVNSLAATSFVSKPKLLCYCLMSNHFHLLLHGTLRDCLDFYVTYIKKLISFATHAGLPKGLLHFDDADIQAVTTNKQFKNEVLYILRNPYKARICSPFSYRWSSIDVLFNPSRQQRAEGKAATVRELRQVLKTKIKPEVIPTIIDGKVDNASFVDYRFVEKVIGSSLEFFDTLRIYDLESVVEMSHGIEESVSYTDSELQQKAMAICQFEFHVDSLQQLSRKDLLMLARTLARRFGSKKKQIGRVCGLGEDVLDRLL